MEYLSLFIKSIFVDNMIFAFFLGMCSFLAVSKNVKTATGLGIAVIFVIGVTLPINYLLNQYILQPGALAWLGEEYASLDLSFLSFIVFIEVFHAPWCHSPYLFCHGSYALADVSPKDIAIVFYLKRLDRRVVVVAVVISVYTDLHVPILVSHKVQVVMLAYPMYKDDVGMYLFQ